jgi:6-pyruvoyltetrahydropterin/6-carboxytetrahydropterin synthase
MTLPGSDPCTTASPAREKGMSPVLTATKTIRFSAAHSFHNPSILDAEEATRLFGKAAREGGHGHDYRLEVTVEGPVKNDGMILNLTDLKLILQETVTDELDCRFLDREIAYFKKNLPTGENILLYLWPQIAGKLPPGIALHRMTLDEAGDLTVTKMSREPVTLDVTRRYDFCASHRLHDPALDPEENARLYGKCNLPGGHGHTYHLEVTVQGEPDRRLGTVVCIGDLDRVVEERVLELFDHRNMNLDVPALSEVIPTTENVLQVIWDILAPPMNEMGTRLRRLRLSETPRNHFELSTGVLP